MNNKTKQDLVGTTLGFVVLIGGCLLAREFVLQNPSWEWWNYPMRAYNACLIIFTGLWAVRIVWILLRKK
jgi:hypothetical protein